jgi:hypothetical protein
MTRTPILASVAVAAMMAAAPTQAAMDHVGLITQLVESSLRAEIAQPAVIAAIQAQNAKHAGMSIADIEAMDAQWRAEVATGGGAMMGAVLSNATSKALREVQADHAGLVTEVFVMDMHGMNVGQSDPTSDYWQGDEAKFQKTYPMGPAALFVDEVEFDESTQTLQSQVSFTLVDSAGAPVGAVTVGVNVEMLP